MHLPDFAALRRTYHRDHYHPKRRARGIPSAPNSWIASDDVDPTAVETAVWLGVLGRMTTAERTRAVTTLTGQGRSARWIASHLRMSPRTVSRHRRRAAHQATTGATQ